MPPAIMPWAPLTINLTAGLALLLGGLTCFWGYRVFKLILAVVGFLACAALAQAYYPLWRGPGLGRLELVLITVGAGILGSFMVGVLFKAGLFLFGAAGGYLLAQMVLTGSHLEPHAAVYILAGIGVGVLTLLLHRPLIILLTAWGGAWHLIYGVYLLLLGGKAAPRPAEFTGHLLELVRLGDQTALFLAAGALLLALAGTLVQFRLTAGASGRQLAPAARV